MSQYRTPLRYPGGKQRLTPFIREVLQDNELFGCAYVEPYAGGAGVALELLLNRDVSHIVINDSSVHIYAFWESVVSMPEEFCRRISTASLTVGEWRHQREILRHPYQHSLLDVGFSTFFLNRCNRSGVLTGGVIGGLAQTGRWLIDARFSRSALIKRIEAIATRRDNITVSNYDAEHLLAEKLPSLATPTLVYCDPPYYERAERLYLNTYSTSDHKRIAGVIQEAVKHPWLVSYDSHSDIRSLYGGRRLFTYSLQYSAIRPYVGAEVFVFSDNLHIPPESNLRYINAALDRLAPDAFVARECFRD